MPRTKVRSSKGMRVKAFEAKLPPEPLHGVPQFQLRQL